MVSRNDGRSRLIGCVNELTVRSPLQSISHIANVGGPARSVSFHPDGTLLAVGMKNGEFLLVKADNLEIVARKRDRHSIVHDIK